MTDTDGTVGMHSAAPVTAVIPVYRRVEETRSTLRALLSCSPRPAEIIVHVDGAQHSIRDLLQSEFPEIRFLVSDENVGPGGGRNKLIEAATHEYIASFDDDSYPVDPDYFDRLVCVFECYPEASVIDCRVFHAGESIQPYEEPDRWVSDFVGCGCAYRRSTFLRTRGYVPMPIAYGMEEVDVAIQLFSLKQRILRTEYLRVYHDTDLLRNNTMRINRGALLNALLLPYLRYPVLLWPIGAIQGFRMMMYLLRSGRSTGVLSAFWSLIPHLFAYRMHRHTLPISDVMGYIRLRRNPVETGRSVVSQKEGLAMVGRGTL